jgi:hypothetical protein
MKSVITLLILLAGSLIGLAQQANRPQMVAGYPVNYEEERVASYTLPDVLRCADGTRVSNAGMWMKKRRPELVKLFEAIQFGKMPPPPSRLRFAVVDKGTPAFNGKALRKQVTVYLAKVAAEPAMHLLIYLPAGARKPVPLLLNISFSAGNQLTDDPGVVVGDIWVDGKRVKANQPSRFSKVNIEPFIDTGMGFATIYYGDIEPDFQDGLKYGIRGQYLRPGQSKPADDEWGAISAWAWGLGRAMDYFEKDKQIDSRRIALQGASRLGKTVLWAGAHDRRFKVVIASISGEGGAAISRRNFGETIQHITDPSRYLYQFAATYHSYAGKVNQLPIDAHMLIALMAPRPLLLQTGSSDLWSDPKGEFLAAVAAEPVYKLFGEQGPGTTNMPAAGDAALLMNQLGYYMHDGGHSVLPEDWAYFIAYLKKHLLG